MAGARFGGQIVIEYVKKQFDIIGVKLNYRDIYISVVELIAIAIDDPSIVS